MGQRTLPEGRWGAVYDVATGSLVSTGTVIADPLSVGFGILEVNFDPQTPAKSWNTNTRQFDDVIPSRPAVLLTDFLLRFTIAEREAIFDASRGSTVAAKKLHAFLEFLKFNKAVDLDDIYLINTINAVENNGLIAVGRAAQILA